MMIEKNRQKTRYKTLFSLSYILLSGCLGYSINEKPSVSVTPPELFSVENGDSAFSAAWWKSFNRPVLDTLIGQSFDRNLDVAQAVATLEQAYAIARQTASRRFPQVNIEGATSQDWENSNGQRGDAEIGAALTWELDIWGRIGSARKADFWEAQARVADIDTVKLSLSAEIANAYFGAVASHQKLALLREQLKLDRELETLLVLRLESGIGTNVELLQQQAQLAGTQTLIPIAESELSVFENRLDVLLGQAPDAEPRVSPKDTLEFALELPKIGVPAALLLNRPDLLAARAELIAVDADVATAIADRLPNVTLSASSVFSDDASFTGPVSIIRGAFIQPLLDWGRRRAEVQRNKALYKERLAAYTQLYLEALEAVENALVQEYKQRIFLNRLDAQRALLQRAVNAAEYRYKQGVDDYQPVISALQDLRQIERNLVDERFTLLNFRIDLFRAIGGPVKSHQEKVSS